MSIEEKRDLGQILLNAKHNIPKGIEMSSVLLKYAKNPVFPTPFEFHFGKELNEKYRRDEVEYSKENIDPDLAAHFIVTKQRGIAWRGLPIDEVFSDVPKEFYVKSLLYDFKDLYKNILANPVYGILSACRTIAYLKDGIVLSKKEGGEWALKHFDERYFPIMSKGLSSYQTGERFPELDANTRDSFVHYVKKLVEQLS